MRSRDSLDRAELLVRASIFFLIAFVSNRVCVCVWVVYSFFYQNRRALIRFVCKLRGPPRRSIIYKCTLLKSDGNRYVGNQSGEQLVQLSLIIFLDRHRTTVLYYA